MSKATAYKHPLYGTYWTMRARCYNSKFPKFQSYGARGIAVCDRWLESFWNFIEDMGPRPEGRSLDRINNDGNYEPSNCRWATLAEQSINRRPKPNKTGYIGVHSKKKRWQASIQLRGKKVYLGSFGTPEGAACAYDDAAMILHGSAATLNFPNRIAGSGEPLEKAA